MKFTNEQIKKAKECKTLDEFKILAKQENVELSDEQAEKYFAVTHKSELSDEELSAVAGGAKGGNWVPTKVIRRTPKCPFCGATVNFTYTISKNSKTGEERDEMKPTRCACGAEILYYNVTDSFIFEKNDERKSTK